MESVLDFFNNLSDKQEPLFPKEYSWFFCNSKFLSQQENTATALDKHGDPIKVNGKPLAVESIPKYRSELRAGSKIKAWWAGEYTDLNGYFFDEDGGNFCNNPLHYGVTAVIRPLEPKGMAMNGNQIAAMVICPSSFDNTGHPNSYRDANNNIAVGTSFADAIPKSATLVNEVFHKVHGTDFLAGLDEKCMY